MMIDLVVIGLGHVGLPLAARACEAGLTTAGYDTDAEVVAGLGAGRSHIDDVDDGRVAGMLAAGFRVGRDPSVIGRAATVVICVPTGLTDDGAPDLAAVRAATADVAAALRPGTLVVLESTSHPGTTQDVVRPVLERVSGLRAGEDFHLAHSPERIDPGNRLFGLRNTPKVIGGCTPLCAKHAVAFYSRLVDTVVVAKGTREAEAAKLLENTYRYVNIALVDEVALYCDALGIDVWDVLHCAATKPFGYAPFRPGAGVGGHCIPVDPHYLAASADAAGRPLGLVSAARSALDRMPRHVADRAAALLARPGEPVAGAEVLLLGVAYKPDVGDVRHSPAAPVARHLRERGAHVVYHDPHVPEFTVDGTAVPCAPGLPRALAAADLAVLLQDHACYDTSLLMRAPCPVLDTRGRLSGPHVTQL
ncbi:nucleotide sugar dehydrogenase [Streptomyces minutiscleroticus]|uniref:UDP-N-acetyl-D-glucosamine dehydrogenase n=1 Tax=Streptomyces minutiscleroticus TaxID=68238 RepID=A0A918NU24_9ACTN|nr:nucleotide sugar dehydrogenase [Streptomyces minutiscleroticus]GGX96462.1 UDP-N-acetyl-D-glucosamine dehydrogenase [Streptomyces minutiscleroticus]